MASPLREAAEMARLAATGPFETAAEARHLPAVAAIWDRWRVAWCRAGASRAMRAEGAGLIESACELAGVVTGAHDRQLIGWLAGFGPEYCAVFAGLISRANLGLSGCQRCGQPAAAGIDWCQRCEDADAADALAALRSLSSGPGR